VYFKNASICQSCKDNFTVIDQWVFKPKDIQIYTDLLKEQQLKPQISSSYQGGAITGSVRSDTDDRLTQTSSISAA